MKEGRSEERKRGREKEVNMVRREVWNMEKQIHGMMSSSEKMKTQRGGDKKK